MSQQPNYPAYPPSDNDDDGDSERGRDSPSPTNDILIFARNYDREIRHQNNRLYSFEDFNLGNFDARNVDPENVDPDNIAYFTLNALNANAGEQLWNPSNEHVPADAMSGFAEDAPQVVANESHWYPSNENVPTNSAVGFREELLEQITPTGAVFEANDEDADDDESNHEFDLFNSNFPSIGRFHNRQAQVATMDKDISHPSLTHAPKRPNVTAIAETSQGLPSAGNTPVHGSQNGLLPFYSGQSENNQNMMPPFSPFGMQAASGFRVQHHTLAAPLLPATPGQLQFANYAQAQNGAATRNVAYDWRSPQNDTSVPHNDAQRSVYVKQLMTAFIDISECIDYEDIDNFKERWETIADGESVYTEEQIETVCWKLVTIAEALHTRGPGSLGVYDKDKLANAWKSREQLFFVRIEHMCTLLRLSKARCETLLKFDNLAMFVCTTLQLIAQDKMNKKQNDNRQEHLVEGREKTRNGKLTVRRGAEPEEESDDEEALNEMMGYPRAAQVQSPAQFYPSRPGQLIPLANNVGATNQRVQSDSQDAPFIRKRPTSDADGTVNPAQPPMKRHK